MPSLSELGGWPTVLSMLATRTDLTPDAAAAAMDEILSGGATPAQIAGFIVGLRVKGETPDELSGLHRAMLAASVPVPLDEALRARLVDTCGTGGDRSHTINVSTLAALVVAGAGVPVCKHGNRAASSACGSADVLEALGVALELDGPGVARCVAEAGIGFCFAPRFHPALRHAGPTRRELGVPTAFNLLGPLSNPARVGRQVVGVADPRLAELMLGVLVAAGHERAMVVHGAGGLDELALSGPSHVWALSDGEVTSWTVDPASLGLTPAPIEAVRGGDPAVNAAIAKRVLDGEPGAPLDIVCLNAAAALVVGGAADDLAAGLELARASVGSGAAAGALDRLVAVSQAAVG